jgi:hypothetical protein
VKVSAANAWINAWVGFFYFTVQLPFAIMSTIGLGIAAYIYSLISTKKEEGGIVGFAIQGIELLADATFVSMYLAAKKAMAWWYGIDVDPMIVFLVPFLFVLALGILQLTLSWFVYSVSGINSLSGKAGAAKKVTFILAFVGLVIPVLNLFPLISIWTAFVWWRPR